MQGEGLGYWMNKKLIWYSVFSSPDNETGKVIIEGQGRQSFSHVPQYRGFPPSTGGKGWDIEGI